MKLIQSVIFLFYAFVTRRKKNYFCRTTWHSRSVNIFQLNNGRMKIIVREKKSRQLLRAIRRREARSRRSNGEKRTIVPSRAIRQNADGARTGVIALAGEHRAREQKKKRIASISRASFPRADSALVVNKKTKFHANEISFALARRPPTANGNATSRSTRANK